MELLPRLRAVELLRNKNVTAGEGGMILAN